MKKCIPLSFNEQSAIWSALRYRIESIEKSPFKKRDAEYLKSLKKLKKKFQ